MYSGGAQPWAPSALDVNHDDYFGTTNGACPADVANSAFLEPLPAAAAAPPGWPYVNLAKEDCGAEGTIVPGPPGADTQVTFVNDYAPGGTPTPVVISELVVNGAGQRARQQRVTLQHLAGAVVAPGAVSVKENAVFVATADTSSGACIGLVRATAAPGRYVVGP
jgi:hypothetical protein